MSEIGKVPESAKVVRLYRHNATGKLLVCEGVEFMGGAPAICTVLRRAQISGHVLVGGELGDFFAELVTVEGNTVECVALDRGSYAALKNRWMRTRLARSDN